LSRKLTLCSLRNDFFVASTKLTLCSLRNDFFVASTKLTLRSLRNDFLVASAIFKLRKSVRKIYSILIETKSLQEFKTRFTWLVPY
jgi:hypothetical protein